MPGVQLPLTVGKGYELLGGLPAVNDSTDVLAGTRAGAYTHERQAAARGDSRR